VRLLTLGCIVGAIVCQAASGFGAPDGRAVAESPPLDSSQSGRLLDDARDGRLDEFGLVEAALIAGGIDRESERNKCCARFRAICASSLIHAESTGRDMTPETPLQERARTLFRFMHQQVLTGEYQLEATQFSRTLQSGAYNCVTATILFNSLCEAHGLAATAVATKGHVFSRIHEPDTFDIQTTCSQWFESSAAQGEQVRSEGSGREISAVQLIGKIYYNRAVSELNLKHFAEAVGYLKLSLLLDPADPSAYENLLAALNNWSLHECRDSQFARAAELVRQGLAIDPDYPPLRVNDVHVHQQWAVSLCDRGRHEAAIGLLERGYARRPAADLFDRGRYAVCSLWAESLLRHGRTDSAWQVLTDARRRFNADPGWLPYEEKTIASIAQECERQRDLQQAVTRLKRGLELQPGSASLRRRLRDLTEQEL